jgi:NADH-quinone oxidoreductase subunit D/NADH-quinone oxidoreductase subunit C/D
MLSGKEKPSTILWRETCGARLTMNYIVPGGVMAELHPNFQKGVKDFIRLFKSKVNEYDEMVTGNIIFQNRMKNVGRLSKEDAIFLWLYGPDGKRERREL